MLVCQSAPWYAATPYLARIPAHRVTRISRHGYERSPTPSPPSLHTNAVGLPGSLTSHKNVPHRNEITSCHRDYFYFCNHQNVPYLVSLVSPYSAGGGSVNSRRSQTLARSTKMGLIHTSNVPPGLTKIMRTVPKRLMQLDRESERLD